MPAYHIGTTYRPGFRGDVGARNERTESAQGQQLKVRAARENGWVLREPKLQVRIRRGQTKEQFTLLQRDLTLKQLGRVLVPVCMPLPQVRTMTSILGWPYVQKHMRGGLEARQFLLGSDYSPAICPSSLQRRHQRRPHRAQDLN